MSTTLWLSLGRSTAIAVTLLALSGMTHAADIPVSRCVSQKLAAASTACYNAFRVWIYADPTADDPISDAAITKAGKTLATKWSRAERFARGDDCAQSVPISDAVQSDITSAASDIASSIKTGIDPNNNADVKCRSALVTVAGKLCDGVLAADSLAAMGVPQQKVDARRSGLMDIFNTHWTNVTARVCVAGATPDADTIAAAIIALENAVVTDTLTPAAP